MHEAFQEAKKSHEWIEDAYFDASLMGQLYFPEMHKYAVYMPLLLPILLPVVFSLIRMLKDRRSRQ